MPEQGQNYVGNYSAGPGISDPARVFGAADVAQLTNARVDQYVQQRQQQKVQKQAKLAKMLGDLDVKPTGMYEKDVPAFVQAKKQVEDFYTEAYMRGVDPDNARFIEEYEKAKKAKDELQGMVAESINRNKDISEAQKEAMLHPLNYSDKVGDYIKERADQSLPDYLKTGPIVLPRQDFNPDNWKQKYLFGSQGRLSKPNVDSVIQGDKAKPVNAQRMADLLDKKEVADLSNTEQQELNDLQKNEEYNKAIVPGYVYERKSANYGDLKEFDVPSGKGGSDVFAMIPGRTIGAARFALQDKDMEHYYTKAFAHMQAGKDPITGEVPTIKDSHGNDIPDSVLSDAYRKKYQNIIDAASAYSKTGQPMDGVELYAAMDIQEEEGHEDAISAGLKATEQSKANFKLYSTSFGQKQAARQARTDVDADWIKRLYTGKIGSDAYTEMPDGTLSAVSLVADNKVIGEPYIDSKGKKQPNTIIAAQWMINPATNQPALGIQTVSSIKKVPDNLRGEFDRNIEAMQALQTKPDKSGDPSYDPKTKLWAADAQADHKAFDELLVKQRQLLKDGGAGWDFPSARDFGNDYYKGNAEPKDVSDYQDAFMKSAKKNGLFSVGTTPPKKTPTSAPKKTINKSDIAAKAKAAGYTEEEYTAILKKNGVEIK